MNVSSFIFLQSFSFYSFIENHLDKRRVHAHGLPTSLIYKVGQAIRMNWVKPIYILYVSYFFKYTQAKWIESIHIGFHSNFFSLNLYKFK